MNPARLPARPSAATWILAAVALLLVLDRWRAPLPVAAQTADSGHRYVAVTGPYQEGVSLLYVLDQVTQHLAVYEARGGAPNSHEVNLVAVRNISLDTLLPAYNDESDYTWQELREEFERRGLLPPEEAEAGASAPAGEKEGDG